jgi:hypothetical protein
MTLADFWWCVAMACLAWYSTITVYVSVRGVWDIRNMLGRLESLNAADKRDAARDDEHP